MTIQEKKVKFAGMLEERLCAYARSVSHFPTALKEFKVRNDCMLCSFLYAISDIYNIKCSGVMDGFMTFQRAMSPSSWKTL